MKKIKEFYVSCHGTELPLELYSLDYIWDKLNKNKNLFGMLVKMESATKAKIKQLYNGNSNELGKNTRYFAYIKFFKHNRESYGIVGGKTNYTNPDLNFDMKKAKNDNRYSRNFLHTKGLNWDETIIIVNHKPTDSEEADEKEALFVECYLQRIFNLFES